MPILDVAELRVRYRGFAFGPASLRVEPGDFLSLIGPNGSGKSTFISSILGLNSNVVSGSVTLMGESAFERPREVFAHVGYVTDSPRDVLGEFTAREYWNYCRCAYGAARGIELDGWDERADKYSHMLDFPMGLKRPISALSLGTARKVQIIAALLPDPSFLVLDEPFIGLDFIASRAFEGVLIELRERGATVLASSHDLDLAARVANRILVLRDGMVILDETAHELDGTVEEAVSKSLARTRGALRRRR